MTQRRHIIRFLVTTTALAAATAFAGQACAQDAATAAKIEALEAKIAELAQQVADLKQQTAVANQDLRDQVAATPVVLANARPTVATADGQQKFAVRSVVQFDAANYDEKTGDLNSGTNLRRARLGIEGGFAKDWSYNLTGEFGGTGVEQAQLNAAYVEYAGFKPFGLTNPVRLRLGAFAVPAGLEDATSNTEGLFLERAAVAEMVRNIAGGDGRSGAAAFANGDHWYASAALTGAVAATSGTTDEQLGYMARAAFNPLYAPDYSVHVGVNVQGVLQPAETAPGVRTFTFQERPELRVDGTRLVATQAIPLDGLTVYGLELGAHYKNLQFASEAYRIDVDGTGAFSYGPRFSGWYAHLSYVLTGEAHTWNPQSGGYRGVKPAKPFGTDGGLGAWELVARYSHLDLDDREGPAGSAIPLGGVRGGEQDITTIGLNWYPNNVFRFLLHYQWIQVDRLNNAGAGIGQDLQAVSLRSQFAF